MTNLVSEPIRRTVIVVNPLGLHMRPASQFAQMAANYNSDVTVWNGEKRANGKSLWDLVGLCAMQGSELMVEAEGTDAMDAMDLLLGILASPGDPDY